MGKCKIRGTVAVGVSDPRGDRLIIPEGVTKIGPKCLRKWNGGYILIPSTVKSISKLIPKDDIIGVWIYNGTFEEWKKIKGANRISKNLLLGSLKCNDGKVKTRATVEYEKWEHDFEIGLEIDKRRKEIEKAESEKKAIDSARRKANQERAWEETRRRIRQADANKAAIKRAVNDELRRRGIR